MHGKQNCIDYWFTPMLWINALQQLSSIQRWKAFLKNICIIQNLHHICKWLPWDGLISKHAFSFFWFSISAASLWEGKLLNSDTNMSCADKPTVGGLPPIIPFQLEVPIIVSLSLPIRPCLFHSSQVKTALCRSVWCYLGTSILWWIRGCCIKAVWSKAGRWFTGLPGPKQTELLLLLKLFIIPSVVFD